MKTFNGIDINLNSLSLEELERLHYEEELHWAAQLKKMQPFSEERYEAYSRLSGFLSDIRKAKDMKIGVKKEDFSRGARERYEKLVNKVLKKYLKKKESILFFEGGVGAGRIIRSVCKNFPADKVKIKGCDVI